LETLIAKIQEKRVELKHQQNDLKMMLKELADAENKCRKALNGRINGESTK
jgi:hypothetical protein